MPIKNLKDVLIAIMMLNTWSWNCPDLRQEAVRIYSPWYGVGAVFVILVKRIKIDEKEINETTLFAFKKWQT
jgi:hypothetical protein